MDDCCYSCHALDSNEVFKKGRNVQCQPGLWPNQDRTSCERINLLHYVPNYDKGSGPVLTVDILSALFVLIILAFSVLFIIKRNDPIVFKTGLIYSLSFTVE